jgi:chemotaxis response regulator CheB
MNLTAAKARSLLESGNLCLWKKDATRKSVDVLFRSGADVYNGRVLGVVMPGIGSDRRQGRALLHAFDDAIGATAR